MTWCRTASNTVLRRTFAALPSIEVSVHGLMPSCAYTPPAFPGSFLHHAKAGNSGRSNVSVSTCFYIFHNCKIIPVTYQMCLRMLPTHIFINHVYTVRELYVTFRRHVCYKMSCHFCAVSRNISSPAVCYPCGVRLLVPTSHFSQ